jgi:hypothetical protein
MKEEQNLYKGLLNKENNFKEFIKLNKEKE